IEAKWDGDNEEHPADQWTIRLRNTKDAKPGTYKYTIKVSDHAKNIYDVGIASEQFVFLDPAKVETKEGTD
ncbi:MAG: hypothetical protein ABEI52_04315, partial [Halobacteriaceae archaeon]